MNISFCSLRCVGLLRRLSLSNLRKRTRNVAEMCLYRVWLQCAAPSSRYRRFPFLRRFCSQYKLLFATLCVSKRRLLLFDSMSKLRKRRENDKNVAVSLFLCIARKYCTRATHIVVAMHSRFSWLIPLCSFSFLRFEERYMGMVALCFLLLVVLIFPEWFLYSPSSTLWWQVRGSSKSWLDCIQDTVQGHSSGACSSELIGARYEKRLIPLSVGLAICRVFIDLFCTNAYFAYSSESLPLNCTTYTHAHART